MPGVGCCINDDAAPAPLVAHQPRSNSIGSELTSLQLVDSESSLDLDRGHGLVGACLENKVRGLAMP